jgi:hypothetical protein
MLRANVGLSRKVSKDYNSTGFTVNLDGEINAPLNDPEAVMEQMRELFDVAEEALNQQIDRHQSDSAIASRDEEPRPAPEPRRQERRPSPATHPDRRGPTSGRGFQQPARSEAPTNGNGRSQHEADPATNKQVNYLLNIGKRQRLSTAQLERKVGDILGHQVGLYDLTKQQAARAIDALTNGGSQGNGRTEEEARY